MNVTLHQNLVHLNWNEPFMDGSYSGNIVDDYLLEINSMAVNSTEVMTMFSLPPNVTDITIGLRASNCFGLTPVTIFHFSLLQGREGRFKIHCAGFLIHQLVVDQTHIFNSLSAQSSYSQVQNCFAHD